MTLARYVRGYDKTTDRLGAAHRLIAANPDDPALIDPYRLRLEQVLALGIQSPPEGLIYYLEAEEDPHTVAVIRDAARDAA